MMESGRGRLMAVARSRRGQWLLCALLAIACCAAGWRVAALLLVTPATPRLVFPVPAVESGATLALYPGGPGAVAAEELAEASVAAELLGVISGEGRAFANMAVAGAAEKVFAVGDELAPGVSIEAIEATRVVVREGGVARRISLKSRLDEGGLAGAVPGEDAGAPVEHTGSEGLRVSGLDGPVAGIVNGDVIVAVDGVPVAALLEDPPAIEALGQRQSLSLRVLRDNTEFTLAIDGAAVRALLAR